MGWSSTLRLGVLVIGIFGSLGLVFAGFPAAGAVLHFCIVAGYLWGTLNPNSRLFGPIITHAPVDIIWLTIDDGPDPADTPRVLDLLDKFGVKATFFVIGSKAEAHPQLIREMVVRGHQVGNHTHSHPQASLWCHGPQRTRQEILRCQELLTPLLGHPPTLFRAPVGHSNPFVHPVLRETGMKLVGWSSRGFDGVAMPPQRVLAMVKATLAPGKILLLHEGRPHSVENLEAILTYATQQGWRFTLPST